MTIAIYEKNLLRCFTINYLKITLGYLSRVQLKFTLVNNWIFLWGFLWPINSEYLRTMLRIIFFCAYFSTFYGNTVEIDFISLIVYYYWISRTYIVWFCSFWENSLSLSDFEKNPFKIDFSSFENSFKISVSILFNNSFKNF